MLFASNYGLFSFFFLVVLIDQMPMFSCFKG